jgi:type II secretory pathway pseudopilin PulG
MRCAVQHASRRGAAGYALLVVVFLAAVMSIAAVAAVPQLITQHRREMEEEMIWRGKQYVRAVRLYYRKNGRFPQSLEELTDSKTMARMRFLRQPYKDPMNDEDGTWRLIYVAPNGQLIGSITQTGMIQLPGAGGGAGQRPVPGGGFGGPPGKPPQQTPGKSPPTTPTTPGTPLQGPVFGGNIIGVASKIERSSLKVYNDRSIYREWEFIWDPTRDTIVIGQPGTQPGVGPGRPQGPQFPPKRQ